MTLTTPVLQLAGWTLIHFVWQGCAIAAVAAVLLRVTRRRSPNVRYVIACAALAAMVAAPAMTARLLWPTVPADTATQHPAPGVVDLQRGGEKDLARASAFKPTSARPADAGYRMPPFDRGLSGEQLDRIARTVTIVWLVGVCFLLVRMAGGWWHVRRLHRAALATASSQWQTACRRIAYRLGLPAAAHVVESIAVDVPTVIGWIRPAIILPVAALAALTPVQVEAILAHELAHIRRHDYAVNLLQTFAETLLFYHPAVWWMSTRIRTEREHCCDDVAVRVCGDAIGYAQALAELETWRTASRPMALAATGGSLLDRVRRILRVPMADEPRSSSWAATLALSAGWCSRRNRRRHLGRSRRRCARRRNRRGRRWCRWPTATTTRTATTS